MRTRPQVCLSPNLGRGLTRRLHQTLRMTGRRCGGSHALALGRLDTRSCQWLTPLRRLSRSRIGRVPEAESVPISAAKILREPSGCSSVFPTASPPADDSTSPATRLNDYLGHSRKRREGRNALLLLQCMSPQLADIVVKVQNCPVIIFPP